MFSALVNSMLTSTIGPLVTETSCFVLDSRDGKALELFLQNYFDGTLKRYLKSEPIPESNDGPVKVRPHLQHACDHGFLFGIVFVM